LRGGWTSPLRWVAEDAKRLETGRKLLPPAFVGRYGLAEVGGGRRKVAPNRQ
jgi:hypothetical protein